MFHAEHYLCIVFTKCLRLQETVDPTWDDTGAGTGLSMAPPQGSEQLYNNTHVCISLLSN